jgi:hypothetical protein
MTQIVIRVDKDRMRTHATIDQILDMQEGRLSRDSIGFLANFVVGDGDEFLPFDQARAALGKLTPEQMTEVMTAFRKAADEAAVPNA